MGVCACVRGHVIMLYVYASCTCNKDKAIWYKNFLIACTNDALQQLDRNYNEANKTAERAQCRHIRLNVQAKLTKKTN